MKKKNVGFRLSIALVVTILTGITAQATITAADITGSVTAPHVNIAIFHKLHGQNDFTYPKEIKGHDILGALHGKAQFIALNHTSGLQNGDIMTLSNDVLREGNAEFEDFGVDCQLSFNVNKDEVTLAGMCEILMIDQDFRTIEHKGIIKPFVMHSSPNWVLIYYDVEDGIAVYASEEVGNE